MHYPAKIIISLPQWLIKMKGSVQMVSENEYKMNKAKTCG